MLGDAWPPSGSGGRDEGTIMEKQKFVRVGDNLYRRGEVYYAAAVPPGKRHLTFRSLGETKVGRARAALPAAVDAIRRGGDPSVGLDDRSSWADLLDAYAAHKRRTVSEGRYELIESTIRLHLKPWFAASCPRVIATTPQTLISWHAAQLEAEVPTWTIHTRWGVLTGALKFAVRANVLATSPADLLSRGERPAAGASRPEFLTDEQIAALLGAMSSERWRNLALLMVFGGLRISEALGLTWQDVDTEAGVIRVRWQLRRGSHPDDPLKELKTHTSARDVALMDEVAAALRRMRLASAHSLPEDPVFATRSGRHVTQRNAAREFANATKRAGLTDVTPHTCRHTFASILIAQGGDVVYVADQMGHGDPSETLKTYAKLFRAQIARDASRKALSADFGALVQSGGRA